MGQNGSPHMETLHCGFSCILEINHSSPLDKSKYSDYFQKCIKMMAKTCVFACFYMISKYHMNSILVSLK